ncbi:ubiquitin domain-containing protein 7SL RNA1-like [Malania oleifera]|uniref:ubiquitin domain-containing protein 7SL RNA1-like n=1 Tax=Malania oleifera TaxID=397392 RepID=UPI0025ADFCDB|nr:ubiquitin domain-containing protein 7SL RNA1-like [Malania oleifera]
MDVIFEPTKGKSFSMEVGFFDTIGEIKEKIEKYEGIPAANQTLIFNHQVLEDDRDVGFCEILENSRVNLIVEPAESEKPAQKNVHEQSLPGKIQLHLRTGNSKVRISLDMDMDMDANIGRLKEKISQSEGVSFNRLVVHAGGAELQDHQTLWDCKLGDGSEIEVGVRAPTRPGPAVNGSKKLRVVVVTRCGTRRIPVEVNPWQNVGVIRKMLERQQEPLQFKLPEEGYFFIHKQSVMDDDQSFRWHQVEQGDIIEIFNGRVTTGPGF